MSNVKIKSNTPLVVGLVDLARELWQEKSHNDEAETARLSIVEPKVWNVFKKHQDSVYKHDPYMATYAEEDVAQYFTRSVLGAVENNTTFTEKQITNDVIEIIESYTNE